MSTKEILEELPKLNPADFREVRDRVWQLEEEELLRGAAAPSEEETRLLDRELADYAQDAAAGTSWEEVESRLKQ